MTTPDRAETIFNWVAQRFDERIRAYYSEADLKAGKKIQCPLLVLWAATGAMGKLYDVLNIWRRQAVDMHGRALGCGHFLAEERPDDVLAEVTALLQ